ncbi:MAG: class I SAM-dependent methyltransferase [Acidobacteria bacterium]|nr:class I SAM-dependent methyltransferase [Acidobacteriota bacterium]
MKDVRERVASLYDSRFLAGYARWKIKSDPAYAAAFAALPNAPLLDLGCGPGVMMFYLRERGFTAPILGIDHDEEKIAAARKASRYEGLELRSGDARAPIDFRGSTVMLDILHYFKQHEQQALLRAAAERALPGSAVVIRDCVRDGSWRYRATYVQESFSRVIGWLRAERLHFPTREEIEQPFAGFDVEVRPMWGHLPFNNYLFVFRRPSSGITNA